jgi:hypothetical protein
MWIKTIPKPSKGSHNELGLYIYHHPKKKKKKKTQLLKLHSTNIYTHKKKKRKIERIYRGTHRSQEIDRKK